MARSSLVLTATYEVALTIGNSNLVDHARFSPRLHAAREPGLASPYGVEEEGEVRKISTEAYEAELFRLQTELVKLQEWVRATGIRIVIIFEGRDAAGKGGTIKRITEYLSPRVAPIIALPSPTERERGQWYYQRYIAHLPARGEIVLLDRSWYNRAGVEKVMGFCTPEEYALFMRQTPIFEQMLIDDGILLRKYWFSVSDGEQLRRFKSRMRDPVRRWKLSPIDVESINRWEDYSRAKDEMMMYTDIPSSPWFVVESDVKKHARLNMIAHLLSTIALHRGAGTGGATAEAAHLDHGLSATAARPCHLRAGPRRLAPRRPGEHQVSVSRPRLGCLHAGARARRTRSAHARAARPAFQRRWPVISGSVALALVAVAGLLIALRQYCAGALPGRSGLDELPRRASQRDSASSWRWSSTGSAAG